MNRSSRLDQLPLRQLCRIVLAGQLVLAAVVPTARAQEAAQTGTISGKVTDENGAGVAGAQVYLVRPAIGTQAAGNGNYVLQRVPAGTQMLHVRMLGFRPDSASIDAAAGQTATHDFTLRRDPLQLETMVVTAT